MVASRWALDARTQPDRCWPSNFGVGPLGDSIEDVIEHTRVSRECSGRSFLLSGLSIIVRASFNMFN
jgi:hypothetical protein